ncbi:MAG: GAF domain-containing protein, partial [Candidatus Sulfotelmatobacter sp.]
MNERSELSGDYMQTSKAQCCDDTEADSRVDAVASRRLGIRSFLISPVLKQGKLVGLFEIFSPLPKAFGDRDIQTLQALSRQILINVD